MDGSPETQGFERRSLGRSIAAGGIGIVAFGAALALAWYSAATLFMLFAGILFGVFLTAMADLLRRLNRNEQAAHEYGQALRLATNERERGYLERRLREVSGKPG